MDEFKALDGETEWKEIEDYDGYYISNKGRVVSNGGYGKNSRNNPFFLKLYEDEYMYYDLYNNDCKKRKKLHILLAKHFIPNPYNLPVIDHKNQDKKDNRLENLRYVSISQNSQNRGKNKNNKIGYKNISFHKSRNKPYKYKKTIENKTITLYFHTLQEALDFKYYYESFN